MTKTDSIVFIVDDDVSVRKGLKRLVKSAGLDVETFPSFRTELVEFLLEGDRVYKGGGNDPVLPGSDPAQVFPSPFVGVLRGRVASLFGFLVEVLDFCPGFGRGWNGLGGFLPSRNDRLTWGFG